MVTLNATVYPDEAYVLVQVDWAGTLFRDTFTRVVASSWGTPDVGPAYTDFGGIAANRSVNGTEGVLVHTTLADRGEQAAIAALNVDVRGSFTNEVIPTGTNIEFKVALRFQDSSNFVEARMFLLTTDTVSCSVRQVIGGVETNGGFPVIPGLTTVMNFSWRFYANGSTLLFKAWPTGTPEPLTWHGSLTTTWLVAGSMRVGTNTTGITNALPVTHRFDNIVAVDPTQPQIQYATVTRRNTVTGEIVELRPYIAYDENGNLLIECGQGLWWDTEPPLNVPLEYCAVASDVDTAISVNCCFEGNTVIPWTSFFGATLTTSTVFEHEGLISALVTPDGTTAGPGFQQILGTLPVAGEPVTISAWVLSPQGWNGVWIEMQLSYADGTLETAESPVEILDDAEWRFLQHEFTPRTTVTQAVLRFRTIGTPPGATLFYVDEIEATQKQALAATACETVTVSSESVWLKSPLNPCSDVEIGLCSPMMDDCGEDERVSYVGHEQDDYAPNTTLWQPLNQRHPIPINRIRRDATSILQLLAHDCEARDALQLANLPGDPLLFQAPATYCIPDRYISVGVVSENRISVDQRDDFRFVSMPYATVARPSGPANGVCGARIDDLCDIYTSWAALTIAGFTWTDLLLGLASPNGPGQPDPPAAARTWDEVEVEFTDWDDVEAGGTRNWDEVRDGL